MTDQALRGRITRIGAAVLGTVNLVVLAAVLLDPTRTVTVAALVLAIGVPHVGVQLALAAAPLERWFVELDWTWALRGHVLSNLIGVAIALSTPEVDLSVAGWLVGLLVVYSALVLPAGDHVATTLVGVGLLAVPAVAGSQDVASAAITMVAIAGIAVLAGLATRSLAGAYDQVRATARTASRSADALRAVVTATRPSPQAGPDDVLALVTTAVGQLGSDVAALCVWRDGEDDLRVVSGRGLGPLGTRGLSVDPEDGVAAAALGTERTTVGGPGQPVAPPTTWRELGVVHAVATPLVTAGTVTGLLLGGRTDPAAYSPEELAAFELLGDHAGRSLELTRSMETDRRTLARLRQIDEMKRDVVATVSHELRTPLTIVAGIAETLQAHLERIDAEGQRRLLGRLHANAMTLERIVAGLLDVSALDRGILSAEFAPVDLGELVQSCVDRLEPVLDGLGITVQIEDDVVASGDDDLLERVVDNLLTNADRHTPAGTNVQITVRRARGVAEVVVADDGPGIAPADLPHVRERFVRGHDADRADRGGLGLGLALCEEILRLHESRLEVSSMQGRGATFAFQLPLARVPGSVV